MTDDQDRRMTSALDELDSTIAAIEQTDTPTTLVMRDLLVAGGNAIRRAVEDASLATLDQKAQNLKMVESHNEFVKWFGDLRDRLEGA